MNVLILGCGGFIGTHLTKALLRDGHEVTGIDVTTYKIADHFDENNFLFMKKDIYDEGNAKDIEYQIVKSDVVVLLATLCNPSLYVSNPLLTIRSNFIDPMRIVDMCTKFNKWLINFSSSEVYGRTLSSYVGFDYNNPDLYFQDEDVTPMVLGPIKNHRWSYACAKQMLERYLHASHMDGYLDYTTIRPYNFVGPLLDYIPGIDGMGIPRVVACFVDAILKNEPINIVDGGDAKRVFTYIDDAVSAIIAILNNKKKSVGKIFNVANPENEVSIRNLAELVKLAFFDEYKDAKYLGHQIKYVDSKDFYGVGYEDCDRRVPKIDNILSLGWKPKYGLEETIFNTVKGFIKQYAHRGAVI